ncbi:MAG: hypothetical protein GF383_11625 [Candidatus Lokiarchaeota archaeon]|nr:hypothetical protein [Candidatus Lokiarchaeota archaeon]MBD3341401.1 hypothetical protein [Candidatus Lokiarchaeota archaeon]
MSYRIILDLAHGEKLEEFPEFSLGEEDYHVEYIDKGEELTLKQLEDFDILLLGDITHSEKGKEDRFTPDELRDIKKFVGEGGALFVTSGEDGDSDIPMKEGSIRVLYKITGVRRYWNGIILEAPNNFLVKKRNILITELYSHPITKGINELVLPNATFFTLSEEDVDDLIVTSEKARFKYTIDEEVADVGQVPICVISKFYNGRCFTIGSSDWMREDSDFGIDAGDNHKFLENVIRWLSFEI